MALYVPPLKELRGRREEGHSDHFIHSAIQTRRPIESLLMETPTDKEGGVNDMDTDPLRGTGAAPTSHQMLHREKSDQECSSSAFST